MSYDVYLFPLRDGVTIDEINEFLQSDAYPRYVDRCNAREEGCEPDEDEDEDEDFDGDEEDDDDFGEADEDDEMPPLPPRYIDPDMDEDDLRLLLFKAFIKTVQPDGTRSEEVEEFLNSEDAEIPEELEEDFESVFEYSAVGGMQPLMFSYGGDLSASLGWIAGILEQSRALRIAAFDPQISAVLDGSNAREVLAEAGQEARQQFNHLIGAMQSGNVENEEENEADEQAEDEEKL